MDVRPHSLLSTPVRLSADAAAAIRAATVAAAPHEACGLLFGSGASIRRASSARNVAADPARFFEIDPAHLFEAQRADRAGPEKLIGCWHSHPTGAAEPSAADRDGVSDLCWLWLIAAGGLIRAWRPTAGGFMEVELQGAAS